MNTNKKGDIGLANVIADVTNKGYFLFLPFSDTTSVDLVIADKFMKLNRVQVKYLSIDKTGVLNIPACNVVNGKKIPVDLTQIDVWAIYCPDTKEIYYISTKEIIGKKSFALRISQSKYKDSVNMHFGQNYLCIENAANF